jgi:hypothetical protein
MQNAHRKAEDTLHTFKLMAMQAQFDVLSDWLDWPFAANTLLFAFTPTDMARGSLSSAFCFAKVCPIVLTRARQYTVT